MPIDERWDRLSDDDWWEFARAWVEQLRLGVYEGERDYGESVTIMNFTARPEQQWKFILAAVYHAETDDELGHIAAGPIEHLLGWHGVTYITDVEAQAASDAKFAKSITGVWKYLMTDEIWNRVRAIQQQAEPLKPSEDA
jgi:uncharacterized protein DUF6869